MTRQMTARFDSRCPTCNTQITGGVTEILYTPGQKATHVVCPQVAPVTAQPQYLTVDEIGVYVMPDGSIVKVQPNAEKTRTYAKRWISGGTGERLTLASTATKGRYEFEPGLVSEVAAVGRRMNLEEAKAFILLFGQCARCSLKLSAKKSVERGIGPICIKYFSEGTTAADLMKDSTEAQADAGYGANDTDGALQGWMMEPAFRDDEDYAF